MENPRRAEFQQKPLQGPGVEKINNPDRIGKPIPAAGRTLDVESENLARLVEGIQKPEKMGGDEP
jgi:hypothetical protein